jgi:hypothetical protein
MILVWTGQGLDSLSLLCVVSAGLALLGQRIKDGFTHKSDPRSGKGWNDLMLAEFLCLSS